MAHKIAYIVNHLGQSGVNNVVLDLIKQFTQNGHNCVLFYLKDTLKPITYPCQTKKIDASVWQYPIIHAHALAPMLWLYKHKKERKQYKQHKGKLITTLHCYCWADFIDTYSPLKGISMGIVYLLTARIFDSIVCLSKHMMNYYKAYLPSKKLCYAYNTRDLLPSELTSEELEELTLFKQNSTLIGMNCVLLKRKGIDVMLKALALLPSRFKLFIAGDGKEKNTFISQAKALNIAHRVYFAGSKPQAHRYLPYYNIYALPSRAEGYPLTLLEAAFYGKQIVCSDLPVVKECFTSNEVEVFSMPHHKQLANAILQAEQKLSLGKAMKKKFELSFSPQHFYTSYLEIYNAN